MRSLPIGAGELLTEGERVALLGYGYGVQVALEAARILGEEDLAVTVADARFAKPLDTELVHRLAREHELLVTIEENVLPGGFGSAVLEQLEDAIGAPGSRARVARIGLPDRYVTHGKPALLRDEVGLTGEAVAERVLAELSSRRRSLAPPAARFLLVLDLHRLADDDVTAVVKARFTCSVAAFSSLARSTTVTSDLLRPLTSIRHFLSSPCGDPYPRSSGGSEASSAEYPRSGRDDERNSAYSDRPAASRASSWLMKPADADDLTARDGVDPTGSGLGPHAARASDDHLALEHEDLIAEVGDPLHGDAALLGVRLGAEQFLPVATQGILAVKRLARAETGGRGVPFDLGVEQLERRLEVPGVKAFEELLDHFHPLPRLDCLPRHRPPSIGDRQAACPRLKKSAPPGEAGRLGATGRRDISSLYMWICGR